MRGKARWLKFLLYLPIFALSVLGVLEHEDYIRSVLLWPLDYINNHGLWVLAILMAAFEIYAEILERAKKKEPIPLEMINE